MNSWQCSQLSHLQCKRALAQAIKMPRSSGQALPQPCPGGCGAILPSCLPSCSSQGFLRSSSCLVEKGKHKFQEDMMRSSQTGQEIPYEWTYIFGSEIQNYSIATHCYHCHFQQNASSNGRLSYLTKPLELIMADVTIVLLRNQQGVVQQRQFCSSRWHNVIVTDRRLACATLENLWRWPTAWAFRLFSSLADVGNEKPLDRFVLDPWTNKPIFISGNLAILSHAKYIYTKLCLTQPYQLYPVINYNICNICNNTMHGHRKNITLW